MLSRDVLHFFIPQPFSICISRRIFPLPVEVCSAVSVMFCVVIVVSGEIVNSVLSPLKISFSLLISAAFIL